MVVLGTEDREAGCGLRLRVHGMLAGVSLPRAPPAGILPTQQRATPKTTQSTVNKQVMPPGRYRRGLGVGPVAAQSWNWAGAGAWRCRAAAPNIVHSCLHGQMADPWDSFSRPGARCGTGTALPLWRDPHTCVIGPQGMRVGGNARRKSRAYMGGDSGQTRAAASTGAEGPPTDRRVTSNTCGVPLAGAGERCYRLGRTYEEVAIDGRCSQMAALRLVAQFPELVPVDWSAQCSVSCTCPMWKHVIDTKCSPPVMKE